MHLVKSLFVLALATPLVLADPRGHPLRRRAGNGNMDSSSSSSSVSSLAFVGTAPLGTGISQASGTTQEVVITDIVYTTLTTCPITSLVTSGSTSFKEVTTTISTLTRTSTSTLCTKCVAPPSKPTVSATSPAETPVSSVSSIIIFSLSQSSLTLPSISISPAPLQTATSSKPETAGTAASPSNGLVFPTSVSLTVSATSGASSTLEFPGYGIVPSPISTAGSLREMFVSNATSSIIPVYTAALLGNAYGGGFVSTPSIYVTKLPFPNGPSSGVPPGYGSESSITIIGSNVTAASTGLGAPSTSVASLQTTAEIGGPTFTASIASNVSILFGNSTNSAASSGNEGLTPTFVSLSPFGGRISLESGSASSPSSSALGSLGSAVVGGEASSVPSFTALVTIGSSESNGSSVITALIAATSPAAALISEVSQLSHAVLSSLSAAAVSSSPINVQSAVVGSPSTSIIGFSIETAGFSFSPSTFIRGAPFPPTMVTISPASPGQTSLQAVTATENSGGSATSAIVLAGAPEASIIPATTVSVAGLSSTLSNSGNNVEASSGSSPTSSEVANIIPSLPVELSAGPVVALAVGPLVEQTPAAGQHVTSTPTPIGPASSTTAIGVVPSLVIGANGQILPAGQPAASIPTPIIGANGQILPAGQPAASTPTPIIVANSSVAIAVVPSPVVGANGLTSLAVFSTPIAPAAGLTTPAVLLTPIVGANGLTSLAVLATPVVGANGLTSLAIGFETETSPAAGQSSIPPSAVENFILVQSPQVSSIPTQARNAASGVSSIVVSSGSAESPISGGSGGGNYSIHVLFNPTAVTHFQGSAAKLSKGFGVGVFGCMVLLFLL